MFHFNFRSSCFKQNISKESTQNGFHFSYFKQHISIQFSLNLFQPKFAAQNDFHSPQFSQHVPNQFPPTSVHMAHFKSIRFSGFKQAFLLQIPSLISIQAHLLQASLLNFNTGILFSIIPSYFNAGILTSNISSYFNTGKLTSNILLYFNTGLLFSIPQTLDTPQISFP